MDMRLTDPMVGRQLEDRYVIESLIAHGGMATVYLATDNRLERRVAVKIMHAHLSDDLDTVARFAREARSVARLSSPDVVAIYDQGNDSGIAFLVMEYVPGVNLRHLLRERGRLTAGETLAIMDHVVAALATAHAAGLVHRDVKPENVLVTADGRVKLADFGLARAVAGSTVTTTGSMLLGTAAYLAPEQFLHGTADARSDVYSAGIMAFELLTGGPPFTAENATALLHRHVTEDIPAPSTRAAGIPPQVDALVTWAASRDPLERPADAAELHSSLIDIRDRLGLHDGVPMLPVSLTARIAEQSSGRPIAAQPAAAQPGPVPHTPVLPAAGEPNRWLRDNPSAQEVPDQTRAMAAARPPDPRNASVTKRRRRGPIVAFIIAIVIVLAAVAGWWFAEGRYTTVPNGLVRETKTQATSSLHKAGLHARWLPAVHSTDIPAGEVASVSTSGRVLHGATISLALSLGKVTHTVPTFNESPVATVKATLHKLNFIVAPHPAHRYSTTIHRGDVISTAPVAGKVLAEGSTIKLTVSKGPHLVLVPTVATLSSDSAEAALTKAGFVPAEHEVYSDTVASGVVISSSPPQNTNALKGSTVKLTVSKGQQLFEVPSVHIGESLHDAIAALHEAGFIASAKAVFPGGPGVVIKESPTGLQPHGTTITIDYY